MFQRVGPWTEQPQEWADAAPEFSDVAAGWLATHPEAGFGATGAWTRQGAPSATITAGGVARFSDSYATNNRYTGPTSNPATLNWPGVTVVASFTASAISANSYPSILAWIPDGEFYGGYNLSAERTGDGTYVIYWRAGDSSLQITPTAYGIIPAVSEYAPGDRIQIAAGFNKERIWIVVNRNGSVTENAMAHSFGWRNAASQHSVLGYSRSGFRTTPHAVHLAASLPRDLYALRNELAANPWQLFQRREWVFADAAAGGSGNVTVSISGFGISALAGSLAPSLSASISGAAASLAAGSAGASTSVAASGVSATGQAGSLKAALSVALYGLQATGGIGTVTAQIAGNVTVSISGVSATVQAGTVVPALAISVTGLSSTSAVGLVTRSQSVGITGIQSAAQAGTVTTSGGVAQVKTKGLRKTRYVPSRLSKADLAEIARYLQLEFERVSDGLESPFTHQLLDVQYAEPSRKLENTVLISAADGTRWDPGGGEGVYAYYAGAWHKLG